MPEAAVVAAREVTGTPAEAELLEAAPLPARDVAAPLPPCVALGGFWQFHSPSTTPAAALVPIAKSARRDNPFRAASAPDPSGVEPVH
ncbi:MAG TPA: hypothetical protein VHM90_21465 [Phycisphaerae bacterium]|nr:hypothetical protein [Phycisphaerae bacterium]